MKYLDRYAEELVSELTPNARIKGFLKNSAVIGAYAEAATLAFIQRVVEPLRVSTGAVISRELIANTAEIPQIDVIVWQPNPLPSIFNVGDFGLVPRQSVLGVLEVKRSTYSGIGEKIQSVLERENQLTTSMKVKIKGKTLFSSLGVVCLREKTISDSVLQRLIDKRRVVVLTELQDDGSVNAIPDGVMILVNFLASLRRKAKLTDGSIEINIDALTK